MFCFPKSRWISPFLADVNAKSSYQSKNKKRNGKKKRGLDGAGAIWLHSTCKKDSLFSRRWNFANNCLANIKEGFSWVIFRKVKKKKKRKKVKRKKKTQWAPLLGKELAPAWRWVTSCRLGIQPGGRPWGVSTVSWAAPFPAEGMAVCPSGTQLICWADIDLLPMAVLPCCSAGSIPIPVCLKHAVTLLHVLKWVLGRAGYLSDFLFGAYKPYGVCATFGAGQGLKSLSAEETIFPRKGKFAFYKSRSTHFAHIHFMIVIT